jgi:hypothetical protein
MVYMTRGFSYDGSSTVAANIMSRIVRYAGTEQALCSRLVRHLHAQIPSSYQCLHACVVKFDDCRTRAYANL